MPASRVASRESRAATVPCAGTASAFENARRASRRRSASAARSATRPGASGAGSRAAASASRSTSRSRRGEAACRTARRTVRIPSRSSRSSSSRNAPRAARARRVEVRTSWTPSTAPRRAAASARSATAAHRASACAAATVTGARGPASAPVARRTAAIAAGDGIRTRPSRSALSSLLALAGTTPRTAGRASRRRRKACGAPSRSSASTSRSLADRPPHASAPRRARPRTGARSRRTAHTVRRPFTRARGTSGRVPHEAQERRAEGSRRQGARIRVPGRRRLRPLLAARHPRRVRARERLERRLGRTTTVPAQAVAVARRQETAIRRVEVDVVDGLRDPGSGRGHAERRYEGPGAPSIGRPTLPLVLHDGGGSGCHGPNLPSAAPRRRGRSEAAAGSAGSRGTHARD